MSKVETGRAPARGDQGQRNISILVLTVLLGLLAGIAFWSVVGSLTPPAPSGLLPWPLLAGLFACAELLYVALRTRRSTHCVSLSEIPLVLGLASVSPVGLVLARMAGSVIGLSLTHRGRGIKLLFNLALHAFDVCVAVTVYVLVLGGASPLSPRGWIAAAIAVVVTDAVSGVLVTFAIVTHDDDRAQWRRLPTDLARGSTVAVSNTCVALIAALAIGEQPAAGVLLFVVAAIAYVAYVRYMTRSEASSRVERLYDFTSRLSRATEQAALVELTLRQVRDEARAGSAELIIPAQADLEGARRWVLTDAGLEDHTLTSSQPWWAAALTGTPVLLTPGSGREQDPPDGMAVPVVLDEGLVAVFAVSSSLPDLSTFGRDELMLFQALTTSAAAALSNSRLVDQLRGQAAEHEHTALHDALTSLPNRRLFTSRLGSALADDDAEVAVLLLDLNGFKDVNDTLGHDTGDRLLQEVGARLTSWLHGRGLVARLGGDEFAVLLTEHVTEDDVIGVADEITRCVAVPFRLDDLSLEIGASVGIALTPDHGRDAGTLLRRADVAMYAAKDRDPSVAVYRAENDHNSHRRLSLLSSLRSAIAGGELYLQYQPQVSPATGAVRAVEALVRWEHPEFGPVDPDEFVALAEQSGLVRPLTMFVLEQALSQSAAWRASGHDLSVAVNLSPRNLLDARLPHDIGRLLLQHDLPASSLTLEITENSIMADRAAEVLERIADLGVELSVDDFGTGYSSMAYLQMLPVNEVKVDKSFVLGLMASQGNRSIVRATVHLAHELGLRVVAEGVEDPDTIRFLQRLGCDLAQGYVYAPALSPKALEKWLAHRTETRRLVSVG